MTEKTRQTDADYEELLNGVNAVLEDTAGRVNGLIRETLARLEKLNALRDRLAQVVAAESVPAAATLKAPADPSAESAALAAAARKTAAKAAAAKTVPAASANGPLPFAKDTTPHLVLSTLVLSPGPMTITWIAAKIKRDRTIVRKAGLVLKGLGAAAVSGDRSCLYFRITDEGRKLLKRFAAT